MRPNPSKFQEKKSFPSKISTPRSRLQVEIILDAPKEALPIYAEKQAVKKYNSPINLSHISVLINIIINKIAAGSHKKILYELNATA